jgi:hypothetical protein
MATELPRLPILGDEEFVRDLLDLTPTTPSEVVNCQT